MSTEITMPKLSDTMEEGKILRWLKHPGDQVHHGEPIAEVETDKADMVMEAFDDGLLDEIRVKEGDSAKVGAVIAVLRSAGEVSRQGARPSAPPQLHPLPEQQAQTNGGAVKPIEKKAPEPGEAAPPSAETQRGRVASMREIRRRRALNEAEIDPADTASSSQPLATAAEAEADLQAAEAGSRAAEAGSDDSSPDNVPRFHPAMSALQSAAPTAIAAAPHRPVSLAEAPQSEAHAPGDGKLRA